jgi:hypothetical protein
MDIKQAKEGREKELQPFAVTKASSEAGSAKVKYVMDFLETSEIALANARGPRQATALGDRIKQMFFEPELQQSIDATISSIPQDPGQFEAWRKDSLMRTMEAKEQLAQEFTTQNLGTSTRVIRTPKYGGGGAEVVEGSEAAVDIKPTVVNVEGIGPVIVDPNTGMGYPAGAGGAGGYTPPRTGGIPTGAPGGLKPVAKALQTNPGALKDGPFAQSQPGYTGKSGGFATFATPQAGIAAQEKLLRNSYINKGANTINKIVNKYAPQGPENSATSVSEYKKYVARRTGVDINAPITAAQVPAVAQAMREYETDKKVGGRGTAGAGTGAPQTFSEQERKKGFVKALELFDYNPKTGVDSISPLIKASTSGGAQKIVSDVAGFFGTATSGRVAIGQLKTLQDSMTFAKLREKLGAQVSDADVRLVASTMGDIANPDMPWNERLAKWQNVVLPILVRGAGMTYVKPKGEAPKTNIIKTLTPDQVRAAPSGTRYKTTDGRELTKP